MKQPLNGSQFFHATSPLLGREYRRLRRMANDRIWRMVDRVVYADRHKRDRAQGVLGLERVATGGSR